MRTKLTNLLLVLILTIFTISKSNAQSHLIHFWDFNSTLPTSGAGADSLGSSSYPLPASYSTLSSLSPKITYSRPMGKSPILVTNSKSSAGKGNDSIGGKDSILDNGSGGSYYYDYSSNKYSYFTSSDSSHGNFYVRTRNPCNLTGEDSVAGVPFKAGAAYLYIFAPTTGYKNIAFHMAISASSAKGAMYAVFDYSTDGGATWNKLTSAMDTFNTGGVSHPDSLQMINATTSASGWYPVQISFASDPNVVNNANFILRWHFAGSNLLSANSHGYETGVTSGNDRFDNFAFLGDSNTNALVGTLTNQGNITPCYGDSNGFARVTTSGGVPPYTYSWSSNANASKAAGGLSTDSAYGLKAGTYTLTITDNNDDAVTVPVTITQPNQVTGSITSSSNVSCNGGSNGSASLFPSGGSGSGFTYAWSPGGSTNSSISGVSSGTYTCTITDGLGCTGTATVSITEPTAISVTPSSSPVTCATLGSASVSVSGGTPYTVGHAYRYSWSPSGSTNQSIINIGVGTYTCTVKDSNGCSAIGTTTVTSTAQNVDLTTTNVTCNGSSNGLITSTVSGGTPPYTYSWSTGATTTSISGLTAGSYTLSVTDNTGCKINAATAVTQPNVLTDTVLSVTPATRVIHYWDFNSTSPAGGGGGDSLGTSAYPLPADFTTLKSLNPHIVYSHPVSTASLLDNGSQGSAVNDLHIVGNDTAGLATNNLFVRSRNPVQNASMVWYIPTTGYQDIKLDWALSASSSKGAQYNIFSYSTDGGTTWKNLTTAMDTFNIGGVRRPDTILAINPTTTASNWYAVHVDLSSDDSANNNPNLLFRIKFGGSNVTNTSGNNRYDNISVKGEEIPRVSCNGSDNGQGAVEVSGGTAPYMYNWSSGATSDTATNLAPGTNTVTVTDKNGCTSVATFTVVNPPVLKDSMVINNGCNNANNGTVTTIASGGTGPYTYSWSNSSTSNLLSSLSPGTYTVTVTDIHGCTTTGSATVTNPAALLASISPVTNVSCNGGSNGMATANVSGGTTTYSYNWSNGKTTPVITGLTAGNYTLTVTDADKCIATSNVTITQPAAIRDSISASTAALCNGGNTGTATAGIKGGTSPYTYSWSSGATTSNATGLAAGTYTITMNDANSCGPVTATVTITEPSAIRDSISSATNELCFGGNSGSATVGVKDGTSPYTYSWSSGATTSTITGLSAGTYTVNILDNNGCPSSVVATINQPQALRDSISASMAASCNGSSTGSATVGVKYGTAPYTYSWSTGETTSSVSSLAVGTYTVSVNDANSCGVVTSTVTITEPSALRDSISTFANLLCYGVNTGSATAGVKGGTGPYTYTWSDGETTATANMLAAGTSTVTINDANLCGPLTATVNLTQPAQLRDSITAANTNPGCADALNGSAGVSVAGGTPGYTYLWTTHPAQTTDSAVGLGPGVFTVTVTDANGCTANAKVVINPNPSPTATFNIGADSVQCDTTHTVDFTSLVSPAGGVFKGTGMSGNIFQPIVAGDGKYTITYVATNGFGCSDSASAQVRVFNCTITGIASVQKSNKITIYPNPGTGIYIVNGLTKGQRLELYNEIGALVKTISVNSETLNLDITDLANGIYLAKVVSENGSSVLQKIVKAN